MIRRLSLTNWRAYDRLDLTFEEGVTFLVAANGVGKSSIVMGAAWGLLGEASNVDAASSVRGDADHASVQLEVELPDGKRLEIERSVTARGRTSSEILLDGEPVTDLPAILQEEFAIDPSILGRLAFMTDGSHIASGKEFQLRDHLFRVFGVSALLDAAETAARGAKEARQARELVRSIEKKQAQDRSAIGRTVEGIDEQLAGLNEARSTLEELASEAASIRQAAQRWADHRRAVAQREAQIEDLLSRAEDLGQVEVREALTRLGTLEEEIQHRLEAVRQEAAGHQARGSAELATIERLREAGAVCPTCLRPITPGEASHAIHEHEEALATASGQASEVRRLAAELEARLAAVRRLLSDLRSVPGAPPVPDAPVLDLDEADLRHRRAAARLRENDQRIAELGGRRAQLVEQLRSVEEAEGAEAAQLAAYRREAITQAAAEVLQETADRMIRERIDPLTREVAWRWKRLFGTGDLILHPDGRIRRRIGSRELEFSELSGGERIWALLVTRLLVLSVSTRVPFVWLDEPLEHLDPRVRRIVAGTLVQAASSANLRQIFVTTYEEPLAYQLAEDNPMAELITVREGV
ncbi:MAG: repair protein SbcC/Rad50 [Actinomycetota bacterium]|nr:repair protein SbcC/Rad50 [Actinomycetota bacterium]